MENGFFHHAVKCFLALHMSVAPALAAAAPAPPITFKVGDIPPPLAGKQWLKGEAVNSFEAGKIYVMDPRGSGVLPLLKLQEGKAINE